MEGIEYIYELCQDLPRCGPGDNESTRRAFSAMADLPKEPYILDIGCGTGMQTIELAKISKGKIIALDNCKLFLDKLKEKATNEGVAARITPKNISMLDMDFKDNTFDIIWSEGALYFLGFKNGLNKCHQLLKDKGYLAVTELVYLDPNPPDEVVEYITGEYPDAKDVRGNIEMIKEAGFDLILNFTLPKDSWLKPYYFPMEEVLPRLNKKHQGNKLALEVFSAFNKEIEFYKKYSQFYGYEFFIMQKQ